MQALMAKQLIKLCNNNCGFNLRKGNHHNRIRRRRYFLSIDDHGQCDQIGQFIALWATF